MNVQSGGGTAAVVQQAPWHTDVTQNFQAAYNTFAPLAAGLYTGAIPVTHGYYGGGGGGGGYGGGGQQEQIIPDGTVYTPGPNSTLYNGGIDQGPQTASPGPYADTQPLPARLIQGDPTNPTPMSNTPYSVGPNDPSGLQPFTNQGTDGNGNPVAPAPTPYDYGTPGSEVPITDNSVPGGFDIGGGGGED
jgi:hypothetical protein